MKKDKRVIVLIPKQMHNVLKKQAEKEDLSVSQLIRRAIWKELMSVTTVLYVPASVKNIRKIKQHETRQSNI